MLRRISSLFVLSLCLSLCALSVPSSAQSLVDDITVPGTPNGIAVNPGNNRIYVGLTTQTGYTVAVIDGSTNAVIDTVAVTTGTLVAAVNTATGRVYAAGCTYNQSQVTCGVSVLDGTTNEVVATIPINASNGIGLEGIVVNRATNQIYVSDASNLVVDVIDGNSNAIVDAISLNGQQPLGLAVDTANNEVLAAINGDQMAVIAGSDNTLLSRIRVGSENANVAANSRTNFAYVTNETFTPSTLGVVNLQTSQVVANVAVGTNPFGVCVDPFTNLIFVTNLGDQTVAVVDGKTNKKVRTVSAASNFIDVNPATRLVYASDTSAGLVHVITE